APRVDLIRRVRVRLLRSDVEELPAQTRDDLKDLPPPFRWADSLTLTQLGVQPPDKLDLHRHSPARSPGHRLQDEAKPTTFLTAARELRSGSKDFLTAN